MDQYEIVNSLTSYLSYIKEHLFKYIITIFSDTASMSLLHGSLSQSNVKIKLNSKS